MVIQEREADLVIGSFGRSVWVLDDIRPLRQLAANNGRLFKKSLTAFSSPDAYQVQYKPAPGYDWSNWGLWDAENRRRGAQVSYYLTPGPSPKADGSKGSLSDTSTRAARMDSITVRIYNDKNELIRNLKWKVDTGFNRQWWGMEERGFRFPGAPRPRPGAPEPAGLQVFPGTYKVVLTLGRDSDSTMVTIKDDPRLNKTFEVRQAQRRMLDRLRNSTERLTTAMDRLSESEEVLSKLQTQITGMEGREYDSLRKATTLMRDSITKIREFISGKRSERQGIVRPASVTVMNTIQTAQQYITSKSVAPGAQEEALVKNAEQMINHAVQRTNQFYSTAWTNYRKHVEGTRIGLFKDYQPIE